MKIIAKIHTDFTDKFGIPRQSGMVPELMGRIVFEPEYRNITALKGLEGFNYIWLIWEFSRSVRDSCRRLSDRRDSEGIPESVCLQHVLRSDRIQSDCHA